MYLRATCAYIQQYIVQSTSISSDGVTCQVFLVLGDTVKLYNRCHGTSIFWPSRKMVATHVSTYKVLGTE